MRSRRRSMRSRFLCSQRSVSIRTKSSRKDTSRAAAGVGLPFGQRRMEAGEWRETGAGGIRQRAIPRRLGGRRGRRPYRLPRLAVVLLIVDFLAELVLLAIDLDLLLVGQASAIHPVVADFFIELGFLALDASGLARSQRAALHSLRDAFLLIFLALLDASFFIGRKRHRRRTGQKRARQNAAEDGPIHFCEASLFPVEVSCLLDSETTSWIGSFGPKD